MNKEQLITAVAGTLNLSKEFTSRVITTVLDTIIAGAVQDGRTIVNGRVFRKVNRAARKGRNIHSGEVINIPSKTEICFHEAV